MRKNKNNGTRYRKGYGQASNGSSTELVGKPAEQQQRGEVSDGVDRVYQGQRNLREAEPLLVDDVKRRD